MKKTKKKAKPIEKARPKEWRVEVPAYFWVSVKAKSKAGAVKAVAKAMAELDLDEPGCEYDGTYGDALYAAGCTAMCFGVDVAAHNPKKLRAWRSE